MRKSFQVKLLALFAVTANVIFIMPTSCVSQNQAGQELQQQQHTTQKQQLQQQASKLSDSAFNIVFKAVDIYGNDFSLDTVWWYFPPNGPLYDGEHGAQCINQKRSLWGINGNWNNADKIYIAGKYTRSALNTLCYSSAYNATSVDSPGTSHKEITLVFEINEVCR
jgi:hypothetical protein